MRRKVGSKLMSPVDAVERQIFENLLQEIYSACEEMGVAPNKVGSLSNGFERILVSLGKGKEEYLIVAGEDENELDPILAMPEIIRKIASRSLNIKVNIVPLLNSYSIEEHLHIQGPVRGYEELKQILSDYKTYSSTDMLKRIKNVGVPSYLWSKALDGLLDIEEVLIEPSGILAFKKIGKVSFQNIHCATYALYDEIPKRFYIPFFKERCLKVYYKEDVTYDSKTYFQWRPLYGCFDVDPLPEELFELRSLAERCKSGLFLHSYKGGGFFLFSDRAPKELCDKMVKEVRDGGIGVVPKVELMKRKYLGKIRVRDGVVELRSSWKTNMDDWVKENSVAIESPESMARKCCQIAATTYVDFYNRI